MAVDIARFPFKSVIRPFADDPTEVTVVWYPCRKDAKTLPFPCDIDVASWIDNSGVFFTDGPGTIQDAPRDYQPIPPKISARGVSYCGTRNDFVNGGVYDPDLPPVIYTSSGLPRCCLPIMDVRAAGGGNAKSETHHFPVTPIRGAGGGTSSAKVTKYPPGPGGGSDCSTAIPAPLDAQQCSIIAPGDEIWFAWFASGTTVTATLSGLTDADVSIGILDGVCPGGLIPLPVTHPLGGTTWQSSVPVAGPVVWVKVTGTLGAGDFCITLTAP